MNTHQVIYLEAVRAGFPGVGMDAVKFLRQKDAKERHSVEQLREQDKRNIAIDALWGVLEKLTKTRLNEKRGADFNDGGICG